MVARCPVLTGDGGSSLALASRGYHRAGGGVLVTHGTVAPELTLAEARKAFDTLLFDFDFQTPSDRSRALAAAITPAMKMGRLIPGFCPIDVVEATESQSGKGYLHRLIRAMYGEAAHSIARKDGGVGGRDESISAGLIGGRPFIELDNLRGKVDSQFLEMVLTLDGLVQCRVPGRGEVPVNASRVTFQATSNGMESTRDLANRSCITRIRKRPPEYTFASFPDGDLVTHVKTNPEQFLGAVFAVIREWNAAGRPRSESPRHDFREWAGILGWIVTRVLGAAPLMEGHVEAPERVSNPALSWLRLVAGEAMRDGSPAREWAAGELFELSEAAGIEMPGLRGRLGDESLGSKMAGRLLQKCFMEGETVAVDGIEVRRVIRSERNESGNYWDKKFYRFQIPTPSTPSTPLGTNSRKPPPFPESRGNGVDGVEAQKPTAPLPLPLGDSPSRRVGIPD